MRVLLLNDQEEKKGGAEEYFYNLKSLLEKNNHEVHTCFSGKNTRLRIFGSIFSIRNLVKTFGVIKSINPDIVHIHKYNLSLSASPAISAKMLGKPVIVTFHDFGLLCCNGWCVDEKGNACKKPASIRWVFRGSLSRKGFFRKAYDYVKNKVHLRIFAMFCDGYIGPSAEISEYLCGIFNRKRVFHVPYFISGEWKFREKKKLSNKLLYVGRLERGKGVNILIEAMRLLPEKITLDIVGDGSEKTNLIEETKDISKRVRFAGRLPRGEISRYYYSSDMLIMPSLWMEQFGIVGIEAMACGTLAIASGKGGVRDWLKNGKNGIIVENLSPEGLAESIKSIAFDIKTLNKFGKHGRKKYERNFTGKAHYKTISDVYSGVKKKAYK